MGKKNWRRLLNAAMCAGSFACFAWMIANPSEAAQVGSIADSSENIHPLDPLTQAELEDAVKVLKASGKFGKNVSLVTMTAVEPKKAAVLAYKNGDLIVRQAHAVLYNIGTNETHEVLVDLKTKKVVSDELQKGVQPMQLEEDTPLGIEMLKKSSEWMRGLERRGVKDINDVHMEMFVVGNPVGIHNPHNHRLLRAYPYYRKVGDNSFGEPIEGLSALVNLTAGTVTVRDNEEIIPLGGIASNYFDAKQVGALRTGLKPMIVSMPEGPSFAIKGHEVSWQKWTFRYELDPREGLVLHMVKYDDDGKTRTIMHRGGISEVSVPYGAPGPDWVWRSPIDEGEYGLGRLTTTLRPGFEVPQHATVIDVPQVNSVGQVKIKPGAVGIWEQDGGILWEHHDDDSNRTLTRRGRQLVIAQMFTLGNYDYFTQWLFNQDGTIDVRVTLNGNVLGQGVKQSECDVCVQKPDAEGRIVSTGVERYGTLVAPRIVGINHQHFFCFRLDLDVDGLKNTLYELNTRALDEGRGFLEQNTFTVEKTVFTREEQARRELNPESSRCWKVANQTSPNKYLGHLPGYLLEPGPNAYSYSNPESYILRRTGFLKHHFWATRFDDNEIYAGGVYPTSSRGGQGLTEWSDQTPIDNEDLVLWYSVGVTHSPRVEDWPVMPAATMGFRLLPDSFFKRNPALDLPEPAAK